MPDYLEQINQQELQNRLQSNLPFKGVITFDNQRHAAVEIAPVRTQDVIRDQIGSYGLISFSDSIPLWVNNPALIDKEEAKIYLWHGYTANSISTIGTMASLVELSNMKATARFYKSGQFSPKIYSNGWKGGSRARIRTYKITSLAKNFGRKLLLLGVVIDYAGAADGQISYEKAAVNSLVSVASALIGGWTGLAVGLIYWGLDSLEVFDRPNISINPESHNAITQPSDNLRVVIPALPVKQQIIKRSYTQKQTYIRPFPAKRH